MKKTIALAALTTVIAFGATGSAMAADIDGAKLFKKKCGICHKMDKKAMGPAVKGMTQDEAALKTTISDGRNKMPKFSSKLSAEEIDALVAFIRAENTTGTKE